jgi:23S rRNA (cytidine1920-2'-O)/16S rRNA (cytidine1409-2'-O)-methyltransferase
MDSEDARERRLDIELVRRGLAASRAQARAAIEAGKVAVGGAVATKPGQGVYPATIIDYEPPHPWVSRGGLKLVHALDVFGVDPAGLACLDVGSSTGGFTDVLLARGARKVWAVDVGRGQLAAKLVADSRVVAMEATDARTLTRAEIPESPDLIVCDASFIGLAKVLPAALALAGPGARLVALFKPQFEVGPAHIGKGGLVKDQGAVEVAERAFSAWLEAAGWRIADWADSPITGGDGNRERLFWAVRS